MTAEPQSTPDPTAHEFALANGTLLVLIDPDAPDWPHAASMCNAVMHAATPKLPQLANATPFSFTIRLATDETVRGMNKQFREKDYPTNVLSFPADAESSEEGERYLGDIIISLPTTRREAEAEGKAPNHHLQHLALHGLLHLLGYDHMEDAEAKKMESLETELLALASIPNPYEDETDVA